MKQKRKFKTNINNKPYTDDDIMPFGAFKGELMKDVPDDYLLWLYEEANVSKWGTLDARVKGYIEDNIDSIRYNATGEQPK